MKLGAVAALALSAAVLTIASDHARTGISATPDGDGSISGRATASQDGTAESGACVRVVPQAAARRQWQLPCRPAR
jgi:hypothetical protein